MSKWKNAPVAYVILQVKFSPVLSLQSYVAPIQEHFRKSGFPAFGTRFNFQLAATIPQPLASEESVPPPIPVERSLSYVFSSRDKNRSFVLEQNALTLHVTDYEDFNWFVELFTSQLTHIDEVIKPDSSERIGIRYIDAVIPRRGYSLSEYLIPEVLALSQKIEPATLQHSYSETVMIDENITTVARIITRNGNIVFPPDMLSLPVAVNSRFTIHSGPHAVLDTDSFRIESVPMDVSAIQEKVTKLHGSVDQAFTMISTDFARKDWKGQIDDLA